MWKEVIFAEIFCLVLWMNPLGSVQNSTWHQSEADSTLKTHLGITSLPSSSSTSSATVLSQTMALKAPDFHGSLGSSSQLSWPSGQGPEHTFQHCCEDQWDKASGNTTRMSSSPLLYSSCVPGYLIKPGNLFISVFLWMVQRRNSINMAESECQCKEDFRHEEQPFYKPSWGAFPDPTSN